MSGQPQGFSKPSFNWQSITAVASLIIALAAIITASAGVWQTSVNIRNASHPDQVKVAQAAAVAKDPNCNPPPNTAVMGACQPKQALALAAAVAPQGNNQVVGKPKTPSTGVVSTLENVFEGTAWAAPASPLRGPDTSHYNFCSSAVQRVINGGAKFWIVAVGDGWYVDPCYRTTYKGLKLAGIPRTTYLFARQSINPVTLADHYVDLIHTVGLDSMPPVDDAEAITSCAWVNTFDNRLKARLQIPWVFDYASPGNWPGCGANGNHAWGAAYGPFQPLLSGFLGHWDFWQYTDGGVGGYPRKIGGLTSDISVFHGTQAQLSAIAHVQPPPTPIPHDFYVRCSRLDAVEFWKAHGGRVSAAQHQQAVRIRAWVAKNRIGCTAPGWRQRPPTKAGSVPYRYPQRKGALA